MKMKWLSNSSVKRMYCTQWRKQQGVSLIEIMIGMVIATTALAAVLLSVAATARSSLIQNAQSAMMENGQFALNLLSKNIRNAGYESLTHVEAPVVERSRFGDYIMGCDSGVFDGTTATLPSWGATCKSSGNNDAVAVRYQGGVLTILPGQNDSVDASIYQDVDCAGKTVTDTIQRVDGENITIVDNRFYLNDKDELVCWGNGGGAAWSIAQNIEQLHLSYGVSDLVSNSSGFDTLLGQTARYMSATELTSQYSADVDPWRRVASVRICILVRSSQPIALAPSYEYTDCNGATQTSGDSHLRRALFTTVEVANVGSGL